MIDFTTIQLKPIPPSIVELQKANTDLRSENKIISNTLIVIAIASIAMVGYLMYNEHQKKVFISKPEAEQE